MTFLLFKEEGSPSVHPRSFSGVSFGFRGRIYPGIFEGVIGAQCILPLLAGDPFNKGLRLRFMFAGNQHRLRKC